MGVIDGRTVDRTNRQSVDRTTLHRIWRSILIGIALVVATTCYFVPALLVAIGVGLLLLVCARLVYRGRDRYIPNLYARDVTMYDDDYRAFISGTLADLRQRTIRRPHAVVGSVATGATIRPRMLTNCSSIWASGSAGRRG